MCSPGAKCCTNVSLIDDWVQKAEADYQGAVALNRRRKVPLPDLVCYHCLQCVQKYLKAFLVSKGSNPPRIHDLVQLLGFCALHEPAFAAHTSIAQALDPYGVLVRYPGVSNAPVDARTALQLTRRLRRVMRRALGM